MRWIVPDDTTRLSVDGHQMQVTKLPALQNDGTIKMVNAVDVPNHLDEHVRGLGYARAAVPADDHPEMQKIAMASDLHKGALADPRKETAGKLEPDPVTDPPPNDQQAQALVQADLRKQIDDIKGMNAAELLQFLMKRNVDATNLTTKKARMAAALDSIGAPHQDLGDDGATVNQSMVS